ncbi:MAG: nitrite reductase small subunit NirD [Cellvibrionales bacterium]|nr:nitrite reductase small subunit NirD [Cellvibrionales bacterium]
MSWTTLCELNDILPNSGRAALVDGEQVALFRIANNGEDKLFAISNYDPFSEANVLARGLVGSLQEQLVVASPIYKQHFNLATGQCLEDEAVRLKTWKVKLENGAIAIATEATVAA